jgi:2-methylcitrate dehydratase PrpD
MAVYPSHYERGFHITGTAGVFGGAAAAGKLLGLDEQQMIWALGIAATQSAGLKTMFGTMCKAFHPGSAGQNGLKAALLASKNYTSDNGAIEAQEGFAFTYSDEQDFSQITDNLGGSFEVAHTNRSLAASLRIRSSTVASSYATSTICNRSRYPAYRCASIHWSSS